MNVLPLLAHSFSQISKHSLAERIKSVSNTMVLSNLCLMDLSSRVNDRLSRLCGLINNNLTVGEVQTAKVRNSFE